MLVLLWKTLGIKRKRLQRVVSFYSQRLPQKHKHPGVFLRVFHKITAVSLRLPQLALGSPLFTPTNTSCFVLSLTARVSGSLEGFPSLEELPTLERIPSLEGIQFLEAHGFLERYASLKARESLQGWQSLPWGGRESLEGPHVLPKMGLPRRSRFLLLTGTHATRPILRGLSILRGGVRLGSNARPLHHENLTARLHVVLRANTPVQKKVLHIRIWSFVRTLPSEKKKSWPYRCGYIPQSPCGQC